MSAKEQIQEYAQNAEGPFTTAQVAEELGLSVSTVRKAIAGLVEENILTRGENNEIEKRKFVTRQHSKPKIQDILAPKFEAALAGVDIMIPEDADADEKRERKAAIKAALDQVTFGNTVAEITATKDFTKYSESHLAWYKSQYLRARRAELADTEQAPVADVA